MEYLPLTAELSVGYVGFVAIFLIFARGDGKFEAHDAIRVQALFTASFTGLFMSLVPLAFSESGLSEGLVYRISSGIALAALTAIMYGLAQQQRQLTPESQKMIGFANNLVAWPLGISNLLCLGVIAFGLVDTKAGFLYLVSITISLAIATSNFVAIAAQKLYK